MTVLCVLPTLRLNRLREEVRRITGDRKFTDAVMEAVEKHLEQGAHRWGNACAEPECGQLLAWHTGGFHCPAHGPLGADVATKLLIAFDPIMSPEDQS